MGFVTVPADLVKLFQEAGNASYALEPRSAFSTQNEASAKGLFQTSNRLNQIKALNRNTVTSAEVSTGASKGIMASSSFRRDKAQQSSSCCPYGPTSLRFHKYVQKQI